MPGEAEVVVETPEVMDVDQAAEHLNGLFAKSEKAVNAAGREIDPVTKKFVSTKPKEDAGEGDEEGVEETDTEKAEQKAEDGEELTKEEKRLLKVKLDGMEQEVPEEEVVKGYLRQSDYTKKTQALAEERKKFEAEEREPTRNARKVYSERLELLAEALQAFTPSEEPNWMVLRDQLTPEQFTDQYATWKANSARLEKINAERARVAAEREKEWKAERTKILRAEQEALHAALPELKDPEKGPSLEKDLRAYAASIGYTDDGVDSVEDHRLLVMLNKARLWDESQKRRPKLEEKVDRLVTAIKPDGTKPAPKAKRIDSLRGALTKSGSIEDAAALLDAHMGAR